MLSDFHRIYGKPGGQDIKNFYVIYGQERIFMESETILVVDDEKEIRDLISIYLTNEGYKVIEAENGKNALKFLESSKIDLIILDIMMPELDGIKTCIKIRNSKNMPIIMLSARGDDMDKIMGLTTGADDYMTKPFNPLELIARVKSQLRRYKRLNVMESDEDKDNGIYEIGDLYINENTHVVKKNDVRIKLTPTQFNILILLVKNKGMIFSMDKIYESVWKEESYDVENTVMVHIRKLRERIEDNLHEPKYIKTVWGVGYKIE